MSQMLHKTWSYKTVVATKAYYCHQVIYIIYMGFTLGFPGGSMVEKPPANAGDAGEVSLIPGSGRSPGGGNGNPLQYSCLGNPMDRGAWWATVHGVTKSQTRLSTAHIWDLC